MKNKWILTILILSFVFIVFTGYSNAATIDSSKSSKGVIGISHEAPEKKLKVIISKDGQKYTYDLKSDGTVENFPLQMSSGKYEVMILENVSGDKYTPLKTETITANIANPNDVYLNSIQNVNWNKKQRAIQKAGSLGNQSKVYDFVTKNVSYDYNKAQTVKPGYNPSIEETYTSKTGICYDYSSLQSGMQRSMGIPTKLVKGYAKGIDGYHAWNEVFIDGKWQIIDTTADSAFWSGKQKYTMIKNPADYQKVYEY